MKADDVVALLKRRCHEIGLREWSRQHGIAPQYIWQVIHGDRPISDTVAGALGLMPDGMRWRVKE